jgi:hypothetical protein
MTSTFIDPDLAAIRRVTPRTPEGCEECLRLHTPWLHLRLCLSCGHIGCCDSSPMRHARKHAHTVGHPIANLSSPVNRGVGVTSTKSMSEVADV